MSKANKNGKDQAICNQERENMKTMLSMEEVALTAISIFFLTKFNLGLSIWIWIPLFLSPDIFMLGYIGGERTGAFWYNLAHHRGIALVVAAIGYYLHNDITTTIGILLFAHSSFDRMLGFGLKFTDDFKHTHLGWDKKKKDQETALA